MTIADDFRLFNSNLVVTNIDTISARYKSITKRLNKDFRSTDSETANSLYVGSYGRGTAIKGFSDLDMFYILPKEVYKIYESYTGNGQSALLQAIRTSIKKTYSVTNIRGDGQVVVVPFDDGIKFEIVPAFLKKDNSYIFPDSNNGGKWKTTNPKPEISAIKQINSETNGNLIQLCRMMRAWRNKWSVPISGLLIDTLAYQFIQTWSWKEKSFLVYDWLSRDFFSYLAHQDKTQEYWRAPGSSHYAWGKNFQTKAKRCYDLSVDAIDNESKNLILTSKKQWRDIYGSAFPT